MCGACGSAGPMVSYEKDDVVQIMHPVIGIAEPRVAKVVSVDDEWGLQLMFVDATIKWIEWEPFACVIEHPNFSIGRILPENFILDSTVEAEVEATTSNGEDTSETPGKGKKGMRQIETEYVTIGKGWLKTPFVLPERIEKI